MIIIIKIIERQKETDREKERIQPKEQAYFQTKNYHPIQDAQLQHPKKKIHHPIGNKEKMISSTKPEVKCIKWEKEREKEKEK